jgi:hypothetical protein
LDETRTDADRFAAYAQLVKADGEDRKTGLVEVLRSASSDFSRQAAMSLLASDHLDEEMERLIVEQIPRWLDGHRQDVLSRHSAGKNDPRRRFVPRAILEAVIDGKIKPPSGGLIGSLEYAARILAFANDPQDETLFRRAVLACPSSPGLWLALGRRGALPPEYAKLAQGVMHDASQPYLARVAAAGALAQTDAEGARFAFAEIRAFLEEFGPHDMSSSASTKFPPGGVISGSLLEEKNRYTDKLWAIGNLLNLDTAEAEQLTFRYLLAPDPKIRRALAIVAAKRWPKRFLEETSAETYPKYEPQEYEMFLSLIAYLHPELRENVEARVPQSMVEKLWKRIAAGGRPGGAKKPEDS